MKYEKTYVEIIIECAKLLTKFGRSPFSRQDIITLFKWKYPDANLDTINPMIQGLTDNLKPGAPSAEGRNLLHSVGEGLFIIAES